MAETGPRHSIKASIHHDYPRCAAGNDIETAHRQEGNGVKPLFDECKKLR
ncbi:MAG TPA: hypothetical protein VF395_18295 [Polyangiaceae bacterium]